MADQVSAGTSDTILIDDGATWTEVGAPLPVTGTSGPPLGATALGLCVVGALLVRWVKR